MSGFASAGQYAWIPWHELAPSCQAYTPAGRESGPRRKDKTKDLGRSLLWIPFDSRSFSVAPVTGVMPRMGHIDRGEPGFLSHAVVRQSAVCHRSSRRSRRAGSNQRLPVPRLAGDRFQVCQYQVAVFWVGDVPRQRQRLVSVLARARRPQRPRGRGQSPRTRTRDPSRRCRQRPARAAGKITS